MRILLLLALGLTASLAVAVEVSSATVRTWITHPHESTTLIHTVHDNFMHVEVLPTVIVSSGNSETFYYKGFDRMPVITDGCGPGTCGIPLSAEQPEYWTIDSPPSTPPPPPPKVARWLEIGKQNCFMFEDEGCQMKRERLWWQCTQKSHRTDKVDWPSCVIQCHGFESCDRIYLALLDNGEIDNHYKVILSSEERAGIKP